MSIHVGLGGGGVGSRLHIYSVTSFGFFVTPKSSPAPPSASSATSLPHLSLKLRCSAPWHCLPPKSVLSPRHPPCF